MSEMTQITFDDLLGRLQGVRRCGPSKAEARCPAHEDHKQSLSVSVGRDGRLLLHCHATCTTQDVVAALGLDLRQLFRQDPPSSQKRRQIVATYDYRDESGARLFQVVRLAEKDFRQRHLARGGEKADAEGWCWNMHGVRRVLYRLPEVLAAIKAGQPIYLTEGEKDANALVAIGLCATTNPGGAGKWSADYTRSLKGASRVYVLPDNDKPGQRHAQQVLQALHSAGLDARFVPLPGAGKDAYDWLAAGGDRAQLEALAACAPPWTPTNKSKVQQGDESGAVEMDESGYPAPRDLPVQLAPVPPWREDLLPPSLRDWGADIADRMQSPPEYAAMAAIVGLGSVIGRQVAILPKRHDTWSVIPHPWGAIVGPPGVLKSPSLREGIRPLRLLEAAATDDFRDRVRAHSAKTEKLKVQREALRSEMTKAAKARDEATLDRLSQEVAQFEPEPEPTERRYVVNDATVERLGEILKDNPNGILTFRDELTGWLKGLERDGREGERSFYLEAWDGHGDFVYDRIGRGTVRISPACVTVLGGIQPGPLGQHLRSAARGGGADDGLLQRFQLLVYPDVPKTWRNVDRRPNQWAAERAQEVFLRCSRLTPEDLVAAEPSRGIPSLHFSDEAQELHDAWRHQLEERIRAGEDPEVLIAHLGKFRSLAPALATIFHLADVTAGQLPPGPVGAPAVQLALRWTQFLEGHALRVYGLALARGQAAARAIARRLLAQDLKSPFTARDIYHRGWAGLTDPDEVREGLELLDDLAWLFPEQVLSGAAGGRPKIRYTVNPRLAEHAPSAKLRATAASDEGFVGFVGGEQEGHGQPAVAVAVEEGYL